MEMKYRNTINVYFNFSEKGNLPVSTLGILQHVYNNKHIWVLVSTLRLYTSGANKLLHTFKKIPKYKKTVVMENVLLGLLYKNKQYVSRILFKIYGHHPVCETLTTTTLNYKFL